MQGLFANRPYGHGRHAKLIVGCQRALILAAPKATVAAPGRTAGRESW